MGVASRFRGIVAVGLFLLTIVSTAMAKYGGGTGEPNDPFQIATAADLIALGETPKDYDKHFVLTADIDLDPNLSGRKVFNRAVIAPDTDPDDTWGEFQGSPFTGIFDGNDHTISHLIVKGGSYLGLFGDLEGGNVKNLGVMDVKITGSGASVGGLVGYNSGAVTQCRSTGVVSGAMDVGGLVGGNYFGTVTNCCSTGAVDGNYCVGALVGENFEGAVAHCYSTGSVSGEVLVGGLVGHNRSWAGPATVTGCYSTGPVSGEVDVGGLVGYNESDVTACLWDTQTSGQASSAGGIGKLTAEMQRAKTFLDSGWDFVGETANGSADIWKIAEGLGYPRLSWEKCSGGTGEPNDPYQIATAGDLIALGETPADYDKHFILTADIDLDPNLPGRKIFDRAVIAPDLIPHEWDWDVPHFTGTPFTGVFDGNNHTISHLTIKGGSYLGLFGLLESRAEIKDLGIVDIRVTDSNSSVGGLIGENVSGNVTRCYCTGLVSGTERVGGLVGMNGSGRVTQCYSTATVVGEDQVGGLVGENTIPGAWGVCGGGTITNCYSSGPVRGDSYVAGLVGLNGGTLTRCYSAGVVSGSSDIGGLVVNMRWGTESYGGGGGTANDCFWDTQPSGQTTNDGGTGKITSEMQTASTFLEAGWDFVGETTNGTEDIWWILEGKDYPRLWWEQGDEASP